MAEKKVEFLRVRDFGQNISDIFAFIRQESKPLLGSFLAFSGIFILFHAVMSGLFQSNMFGLMSGAGYGNNPFRIVSRVFGPTYFLVIISVLVLYAVMQTAVYSYIKLYVVHGNVTPTIQQVWETFRKYILKVVAFGLLSSFMILIGALFCLLPGIYLAVVLSPLSAIIIVEDASFSEAIGRCFYLIRDKFFFSLAVYFIATIIYSIVAGVLSMIITAAFSIIGLLTTRDTFAAITWASSFSQLFSSVFYLIPLISIALNYFSLREQKEGTGIMNRIDNLGTLQTRQPDTGEEDY